jgi:hypothetical protein
MTKWKIPTHGIVVKICVEAKRKVTERKTEKERNRVCSESNQVATMVK